MLRLTIAIVRKDLMILLARGSGLVQAILLGLLLVFVFSLSSDVGEVTSPRTASAVFWLASLFCQVLIFNSLHSLEEISLARLGLVLCQAPVQSVWLGKAMAGLVLLLLAQACFLPATIAFLGQNALSVQASAILNMVMAVLLIDIGICAQGALVGALCQGRASRESMLSIVLFPLMVPVLMAGISLLAQLLSGNSGAWDGGNSAWYGLAAAFDAMYLGAGYLLFVHIYTGED